MGGALQITDSSGGSGLLSVGRKADLNVIDYDALHLNKPHVLYDLPAVVSTVSKILCYTKMADRVRIETGSFFDSVPSGGDVYVLKNIMHDWPDDKAIQILRNVRAATGQEATVLLVELVIPDHDRDFPGKWADLEMLLNLGARERTAAEYRNLLSLSGFEMTGLVPTASPLSLVQARVA